MFGLTGLTWRDYSSGDVVEASVVRQDYIYPRATQINRSLKSRNLNLDGLLLTGLAWQWLHKMDRKSTHNRISSSLAKECVGVSGDFDLIVGIILLMTWRLRIGWDYNTKLCVRVRQSNEQRATIGVPGMNWACCVSEHCADQNMFLLRILLMVLWFCQVIKLALVHAQRTCCFACCPSMRWGPWGLWRTG